MSDAFEQILDRLEKSASQEERERIDMLRNDAERAARESVGKAGVLAATLSSVPSQTVEINVDGARGFHSLKKTGFNSFDYVMVIDIPTRLPAAVIFSPGRYQSDDPEYFGPSQRLRHGKLASWTASQIYTRAPDVLRGFEGETLSAALDEVGFRIELRPNNDNLTVLNVFVSTGWGRKVDRAARVAVQVASVMLATARSGVSFAERNESRPANEVVLELLNVLGQSVAWLSGPVARVGDGVEARLSLDEQEDMPSSLRVDVDNNNQATLYFRGPLRTPPRKKTTLEPQDGFFDKLLGLVDPKIGVLDFDDAWLVDGDADGARALAKAEVELLRLRRLMAKIELSSDGVVVRVPKFPSDETALLDATGAVLSLWRSLVRHAHGLD